MTFDWQAFLSGSGIHFVSAGRNVARGHINVKCPYCGPSDPSEHMGIRLTDGAWGCYRSAEHRGRSAPKLISALTGMRYAKAKELVESNTLPIEVDLVELSKFDQDFLTFPKHAVNPFNEPLEFPVEFRPFNREPGKYELKFHNHLHRIRGFKNINRLTRDYGLRWCISGRFAWRLIFPFYMKRKLVGWSGRAIGPASTKYLSHPIGEGMRRVLGNYDHADKGGKILYVVEGPFDALKLDWAGEGYGAHAVALLGLSYGSKLNALARLARRYDHVLWLLDASALEQATRLGEMLVALGARPGMLPPGVDDPGEMTSTQVEMMIRYDLAPF